MHLLIEILFIGQVISSYALPDNRGKITSKPSVMSAHKYPTFWHYTDFHVDMQNVIEDSSGLWGQYNRDTSPIASFTGIEWGNDHGFAENQPDFVIWGGDAGPHSTRLSRTSLLDSLEFLSFHFKMAFKPSVIPLIPVIGNHDVYPTNDMSPNPDDSDRKEWCTLLATSDKLWQPWISANLESVRDAVGLPYWDFDQNCYHSALVNKGTLLILGLNSLVWYSSNRLVDVSITDPLEQFKWMNDSLKWVRDRKIKAIVVTHVPPGASEFSPGSYHPLEVIYNEQLVSLLREYSDVIITTIASHEHVDSFRVLLDKKYNPVGSVLLGPSVSPIYLSEVGSSNPRFRQYEYNPDKGVIIDYLQYFLDLTQFGPEWDLQYRASAHFDLPSLDGSSLSELLDNFTTSDTADDKWTKFWTNQLGGRSHSATKLRQPVGTCPEAQSQCRCEQVCAMRHLDGTELAKCLGFCAQSETPQLRTIARLRSNSNKRAVGVGLLVSTIFSYLHIYFSSII